MGVYVGLLSQMLHDGIIRLYNCSYILGFLFIFYSTLQAMEVLESEISHFKGCYVIIDL
jgi:hypothetical protein